MNAILENIKSRRSIRKYENEQISDAQLAEILEAGSFAPSSHNDQPWHFTVVQNHDLLNKINEDTKNIMRNMDVDWIKQYGNNDKFHVFYNAPTVIMVSGRKDAINPEVDCSAAIQNMLLCAESLNIGSCWIGLVRFIFNNPSYGYDKILDIPEGYKLFFAVAFGYKAYEPTSFGPERIKDVVNYIK